MTTVTSIRSLTVRQMRDTLRRRRRQYGDGHHAAMCLGAIEGAAASLAEATGAQNAAETLYRAADEIVLRNIPAPAVTLRRQWPVRRIRGGVGLIWVEGWCFVALAMLGVYGCWRWL